MNNISSFYKSINNNTFILKIAWNISKTRFIIKFIITIVSALLPTVNILIVRNIISILEGEKVLEEYFSDIIVTVVLFAILQLILYVFNIWNNCYIEPIIMEKTNNYINKTFIDKAKEFEYSCFEESSFFDKYARALNQVDSLVHIVFDNFFELLANIIGILSLTAIMLQMDGIIIIFVFSKVVIQFIQSVITAKINFETSQKLTPLSRKQSYIKRLLFIPEFAKDVNFYDIISTGKKYYEEAFAEIKKITQKYGIRVAIISTISTTISMLSSSFLLLLLSGNVLIGSYNISEFTALFNSSNQLEMVLNSFLQTLSNSYHNSLEIDNFKYIYNYKAESYFANKEKLYSSEPCDIEVKNLYFKYPNSKDYVLEDVSFFIHKGEKVSIVGLNGSGKTTLIKLLLGLYKPTSGKIYINGKNIMDYSKDDIRNKIGVAFQDNHIYAYSVKENIAFEKGIANNAVEALKRLEIYSKFDSMDKGFDTLLSKEFDESGINLSGGESQKICIARAFNVDACMYVFDEPSSALDPISEYKMNKIMTELTNKTVILVSHRLSTTIATDRILMFEKGHLIEEGSHLELMKLNGSYAELFNVQYTMQGNT